MDMGSNFEMSMIKTSTSHPATALLAATLIMSLNRVPGVSGVSSVDSSSFRDLEQQQLSPSKPSERDNTKSTTEKGSRRVLGNSTNGDDEEEDYCINNKVVLIESDGLPFGGSRRVVGRRGNLTWGEDVIRPIRCASEFVVMYRRLSDSKGAREEPPIIICPSFSIAHDEDAGRFSCATYFADDDCNRTVNVSLETWTVAGEFLHSSVNVTIDCSEDFEAQEDKAVLWEKDPFAGLSFDLEDGGNSASTTEEAEDSNDALEEAIAAIPLVLSNPASRCAWSDWTGWSECSKSCGETPGRRTRTRAQRGSRFCGRTEEEEKKCHVNRCAQDCALNFWSEWSSCSMTCGTGKKTRSRTIGREAEFGGKPCEGKRKETVSCVEKECAVDGEWSDWSPWGYCDRTCGNGTRTRERRCDSPPPEFGGKDCEGRNGREVDSEGEQCSVRDCDPVDGGWTAWSRWSKCSATCGAGRVERRRTCDDPVPAHGGKDCYGDGVEARKCFLRECGNGLSDEDEDEIEVSATRKEETTKLFDQFKRRGLTRKRLETEKKADYSGSAKKRKRPDDSESEGFDDDEESPIDDACFEGAPAILGYAGPFVRWNHRQEAADIHVQVGKSVFYRCLDGKVTDARTNRRVAKVRCGQRRFFDVGGVSECVSPTHCVGHTVAAVAGSGLTGARPIRDASVNQKVFAKCRGGGATVQGSCFPDGVVRFRESCGEGEEEGDEGARRVLAECKSVGNAEGEEEVLVADGDYGWILISPPGETDIDETRFKFDLFRGVISEVVNLTKTAEEGIEAAAADNGRCGFRFLLAEGSKLQFGLETAPKTITTGPKLGIIVNGAAWELEKTGGTLVVDADIVNVQILNDGMMSTAGIAVTFRTFS